MVELSVMNLHRSFWFLLERRFGSVFRERGFTLAEILVVITITLLLTGLSLAYTRKSETQIALFVEQAKVAGLLYRAQALALQGYNRNPEEDACYGVRIDAVTVPQRLSVVRDALCDGVPDEEFDRQLMDARIEVLAGSTLNPSFKAPYLEVQNAGTITVQVRGGGEARRIRIGAGGEITMQ